MTSKRPGFECLAVFGIALILTGCSPRAADRASQLISIGSYEQAITLLESEIQKHPRDSRLHRLLGDALFASAVRAIVPQGSGGLPGGLQAGGEQLMRKALSSYSSAKNLASSDPAILYHRALALHWSGDPQARAAYEQLLARDPKHPGRSFFAMLLRQFGENERADSIDAICAHEAKVQGAWADLARAGLQSQGAFITLEDSLSARDPNGGPTVTLTKFSVFDCSRDSVRGVLQFQYLRREPREGWMLKAWLDELLKDPRLNSFMGSRRKERFIVYEEPTLKLPDEYANSNWTRMPTVDVDRSGRELFTDEELQSVVPRSEVRSVRYPGGIGGLMYFSTALPWQRLAWVETVAEVREVRESEVVFAAISASDLERKWGTIQSLRLQDMPMAPELLRGKIARGLTLRMVEGAVGPIAGAQVGWSGDKFELMGTGVALPGHLLKLEDGALVSWE